MKHTILFTLIIMLIMSTKVHSLELDLHSDINETINTMDFGLDLVASNKVYFTTGLYKFNFKEYDRIYNNEGIYFGIGKNFMLSKNISVSANAKLYNENNYEEPIYCLKLVQRFNLLGDILSAINNRASRLHP